MGKLFSFIVVFMVLNCCFSQTMVEGKVIDAETNTAIPYVNIGIVGDNLGTISREDGSFSLTLPNDLGGKAIAILFYHIGYERNSIQVTQSSLDKSIIKLVPRPFELNEVVVTTKRKGLKQKKLGGYKKSIYNTGSSNTDSYGVGEEYGIRIKIDKYQYMVDKVNFHTKFNTMDSVLFRVNIYKVLENGFPGSSVLKKQLLVKSYNGDKWISADLSDRDIEIKEDVIVTVEPVRLWYDEDNDNQLFYSQCSNCGEGFHRQSSFSNWDKNIPPFAIYMDVKYYK